MPRDELFVHRESVNPDYARLTIDAGERADHTVTPYLYGKFCEHLGNNIYHGMDAQLLFNPVFGDWHFRADEGRPSGGFVSENDPERIREQVEAHEQPLAYPASTDTDALVAAYRNGLAFGWLPTNDGVRCSPDTGRNGNRAQRIEASTEGGGVRQHTHLPLHRVREFAFRCRLRAVDPATVRLSLGSANSDEPLVSVAFDTETEWNTAEGTLTVPTNADVGADDAFEVTLTTEGPTNLVIERLLLYPADHIDYADPEIVAFLRESDLPLLRWPGGNFVSGYDWRDGVGPVDERPTRSNPAWSGLEYNLFGTDEFIQFCENVGCEPMICVNAGDGTPEAAAAWVEYCNGDPEKTELGRLRAAHGHREPYDVTYWEVGNELYGEWQVRWTTPAGNADRYERFREAMLDADPEIEVTACGLETDGSWNDTLLARAGADVRAISDHVLAGGSVGPDTDPNELYHAFMGFSDQLGREYRDLRERMHEAGIEDPKLAITELQLFAHYTEDEETPGREDSGEGTTNDGCLSSETMPTPQTISEALYDTTIRHECIRIGEFVEMLTHSATVNHGGGLQKDGEHVWADPCHYGRVMGAAHANGTPVTIEVECGTVSTEHDFGEINSISDVPSVDVMATLSPAEDKLTITLVNRESRKEPLSLTLDVNGFDAVSTVTVVTLAGETMYERNTREKPERISPDTSTLSLDSGKTTFEVPPYSMMRLTLDRAE